MNSGFRDAMNLGWKLDYALRGAADDALLDTYEPERKPQVAAVVRLSAKLGEVIMPLSPVRAASRDIGFFLVNRIEPAHKFFERGDFRPPTRLSTSRLVDRRRPARSGDGCSRYGLGLPSMVCAWQFAKTRKLCRRRPYGAGWRRSASFSLPSTRPTSGQAPSP